MNQEIKMNENIVRSLSKRVHMDFHTPDIPWEQAMKKFDAKEYVRILKEANLNSLVSFTKCHHGYSYYNTKIGLKHPSLDPELDMFGEILEECHNNDMKVLAYYSIGWLTTIQKFKPEWMERNLDGQTMNTIGVPTFGPWANICLNSPYLDEIVIPELTEIMMNYEADGLWLDIIECNPCHCEYCKEKYKNQYGKELPEDDSLLTDFVTQTKLDFIRACKALLDTQKPNWVFTYNTAGRDRALVNEVDFCSIETHPGAPGDKDAWTRALLTYKFLQKYNKPWESCTSRFIHGWGGWDEQPLTNIMAVGSRIISHGGMINLGDQAYPDGTLDKELYKNIGKYFEFVSMREERTIGGTPVPYVGILTKPFDVYAFSNDNYFGIVKILTQKHITFDIIDETMCSEFEKYKCIILPELGELKERTVEMLEKYVKNGGTILATGNTSLINNKLQLGGVFGCEFVEYSPYTTSYLKVLEEIGEGVRKSPIMIPAPMNIVSRNEKTKELAEVYNPVIEPDYEEFMIFRNRYFVPPGNKAGNSGIIEHKYGKGKSVYIPSPLFETYQKEEQWYLGDVIGNIVDYLIEDKLIVLEAPSSVEINVTERNDEIICHLIQYQTLNEASHVIDMVPAYNLKLKISLDLINKTAPIAIPSKQQLNVKIEEKYMVVEIGKIDIYEQIIFKK